MAQSSSRRRASGQAGNVVDCQIGGDLGLWLVMLAQPVKAGIWDKNSSFFRFDGCVGEVGRIAQRAFRDRLEECRLADIGQANLFFEKSVLWRLRDTAWSGSVHTMPLFKLFPGRPSKIFSSFTAFLGGIFLLAYERR